MRPLRSDVVSVIVPVYNTKQEFLKECFESVLNQSYPNMELVIINDGSTDSDTNNYIREYVSRDPEHCRLVEKNNEGVSVARSVGIMEASGEMLMFLDSDDSLELFAVDRLVKIKDKYNVDAVVGQNEVRKEIDDVQVLEGSKDILSALLENKEASFGWALWGKLFDTTLMRYYYKPYDDIYYGEDLIVNALYFGKCSQIVLLNEKVYNYRVNNPDSAMNQSVTKKKLSLIKMWDEMARIYEAHGLREEHEQIKANYYDSLLSGYLQCAYYKFDDYKPIMSEIKEKLCDSMEDIKQNKYVEKKYKYTLAVNFLWVYKLNRFIKKHK